MTDRAWDTANNSPGMRQDVDSHRPAAIKLLAGLENETANRAGKWTNVWWHDTDPLHCLTAIILPRHTLIIPSHRVWHFLPSSPVAFQVFHRLRRWHRRLLRLRRLPRRWNHRIGFGQRNFRYEIDRFCCAMMTSWASAWFLAHWWRPFHNSCLNLLLLLRAYLNTFEYTNQTFSFGFFDIPRDTWALSRSNYKLRDRKIWEEMHLIISVKYYGFQHSESWRGGKRTYRLQSSSRLHLPTDASNGESHWFVIGFYNYLNFFVVVALFVFRFPSAARWCHRFIPIRSPVELFTLISTRFRSQLIYKSEQQWGPAWNSCRWSTRVNRSFLASSSDGRP